MNESSRDMLVKEQALFFVYAPSPPPSGPKMNVSHWTRNVPPTLFVEIVIGLIFYEKKAYVELIQRG